MNVFPDLRRLVIDVEHLLRIRVLGVTVVEEDQVTILVAAARWLGDDAREPGSLHLL